MHKHLALSAALSGLILAVAGHASAAGQASFQATVVYVTDGDTVRLRFDDWAAPVNPISIRITGIDTPESRKQDAKCIKELRLGLIAKHWARDALPPGARITFTWAGQPDKYFRLLGSITLPDGRDFAMEQIRTGHAVRYDGGRKPSWCN